MYKKLLIGGLLVIPIVCNAGFFSTTVHSRANCINNESITWYRNHPHNWRVVSIHNFLQNGNSHLVDTGYYYKDRQAAIHWGEGLYAGFQVWGYHYLRGFHDTIPFADTYAIHCNFIDGWD